MSDDKFSTTDLEEPTPSYAVYLAGPMTNIPAFNFPKFFEAEAYLEAEHGWTVRNPARKDLEKIPLEEMQTIPGYDTGDLPTYVANSSFTMANAMEWDLPAIMASQGIVLLDGWEKSTGARYERTVAEALGREVWLLHWDADEAGEANGWWNLVRDDEHDTVTQFLRKLPERNDVPVLSENGLHEPSYNAGYADATAENSRSDDGAVVVDRSAVSLSDLSTGQVIDELRRRIGHAPNFREHFPKALAGIAPEALQ